MATAIIGSVNNSGSVMVLVSSAAGLIGQAQVCPHLGIEKRGRFHDTLVASGVGA